MKRTHTNWYDNSKHSLWLIRGKKLQIVVSLDELFLYVAYWTKIPIFSPRSRFFAGQIQIFHFNWVTGLRQLQFFFSIDPWKVLKKNLSLSLDNRWICWIKSLSQRSKVPGKFCYKDIQSWKIFAHEAITFIVWIIWSAVVVVVLEILGAAVVDVATAMV